MIRHSLKSWDVFGFVRCVFAFVVCFACCAPSLSQSIHELQVEPLFGRAYPPGRWVPLRVTCLNNSDSLVDGAVFIPVSGPHAVVFRIPVAVPPRSQWVRTAYGYLPAEPLAGSILGTGAATVAIAEWRAADGTRLARSEVLAQPDSQGKPESARETSPPGFLLLSVDGEDVEDVFEVQGLVNVLSPHASAPINIGRTDPALLPRHRAGYDAVRAVILNGVSPGALDDSQKSALLEYILCGGALILPAPMGEADPTVTWLEPLVPVRIIGHREAQQIAPVGSAINDSPTIPLKLRVPVEISEAIDAGGEILLRDEHYVHAAIRHYGLGRVVFVSFPVNALDAEDVRTVATWERILGLGAAPNDWLSPELSQQRADILNSMIGTPTAPWRHAAMIVGAYVVLTLVIQFALGGARRPAAYGFTTVLAVAGSAALLGFTALRQSGGSSLSAARLGVVELGPRGGGVRAETLAFLGPRDSGASLSASLPGMLTPVLGDANDPPALSQLPFTVADAGVRSGRIERAWHATAPAGEDHAIRATAKFSEEGMQIDVQNAAGQALRAPVLLWNQHCYRLPDLPEGRTTVELGSKNPPGDFTNNAVFTGEEAGLRGRIVQLNHAMRSEGAGASSPQQAPRLFAWLDAGQGRLSDPIAQSSATPAKTISKVLLNSPLEIMPSEQGATIRIPSDFISVTAEEGRGLPFDSALREWLPSILSGTWVVGFQTPPLGRFSPISATLTADVSAPGHTLVIRRGQCRHGKPTIDPDGPIVAQWRNAVGVQRASFDLDSSDVDSHGRVWLSLSVEPEGAGFGAQWKFNALSIDFNVKILEDPQ